MKILFIGMGSIGLRHYRCLKDLYPEFEISAFRTFSGQEKNVIEGVTVYNELQKALYSNPDAAIISNPTSLHIEAAIACAERGVHFLVEKPLSNNLEKIDVLSDLVKQNSVIAQIGCNLRYHPIINF